MSDLDLTELREIAEAATPGPWGVYDANEGMSPPRPYWSVANNEFHNPTNLDALAIDISIDYGDKDDAAHIAAFDPPTVLALIDEVERLRAGIIEAHETITNEAGPAWLAASKVLEDALDVYVRIPVENARLCDFAEMIEQRQVQLEQDRARLNALSKALAHLRMIAGADDDSRIGDLLALDLIAGAA